MLSKASNFTRHNASQISHMRSLILSGAQNARFFAAPTQGCLDHLKKLGIRNKNVVHNPT